MRFLKVLLALGAFSLTLVQSKHANRCTRRYSCPNVEGSPLTLCTSNFYNWCVYYSGGDCESGVCQKQTSNDCTACQVPNVRYYTKKACTDKKVFCDAGTAPQSCPSRSNPVCGYYTENCPFEICSRTVLNSCNACKDGFKYFTPGKCKNPTDLTCDGNSGNCGPDSPVVCGFYTEGCPYGICEQTYSNSCEACSDSKILFQRPGFCENEPTRCELVDIPEVCPTSYGPVCASLRECDGDCERWTRTFDNTCLACQAGGYSVIKNGVCPEDRASCDYRPNPSECPTDSEPVCAFFEENCPDGLCFATANTGCNACSDASIDYYVEGTCKETFDNREYCLPNNRPEGCPDNVEPVCAFKNIVCVTEPCPNTETVSNGCTACQDPSVFYHTPGPCPEDADFTN